MNISDGVYILTVGLALGFLLSFILSLTGYAIYQLFQIIDKS